MIRKLPEDGATKIVPKFAWFRRQLDDGHEVMWEWYYVEMKWGYYPDMHKWSWHHARTFLHKET